MRHNHETASFRPTHLSPKIRVLHIQSVPVTRATPSFAQALTQASTALGSSGTVSQALAKVKNINNKYFIYLVSGVEAGAGVSVEGGSGVVFGVAVWLRYLSIVA